MTLPHEILIEIFQYLPYTEISNLPDVWRDSYFWTIKCYHDFGINREDLIIFNLKSKEAYDFFHRKRYTYEQLRYLAIKYKQFKNILFKRNEQIVLSSWNIKIDIPVSINYSILVSDHEKQEIDRFKSRGDLLLSYEFRNVILIHTDYSLLI